MTKTVLSHSPMMMHMHLLTARYGLLICPDSLSGSDPASILQAFDFMLSESTEMPLGGPITTSRCSVCQGVRMSFHETKSATTESRSWFKQLGQKMDDHLATHLPPSSPASPPSTSVDTSQRSSLLKATCALRVALQSLPECHYVRESEQWQSLNSSLRWLHNRLWLMGVLFESTEKKNTSDPTSFVC